MVADDGRRDGLAAFQFIHIEAYGRRAGRGKAGGHTLFSVLSEAARLPGACPHVAQPQPPVLLFGCELDELKQAATTWAARATDLMGRRLRADGLCLLGGVASFPREQFERWPAFRDATVCWLAGEFGQRLRCVIEHTDEAHPHIHFYCVPGLEETFFDVHPGKRAAMVAMRLKKLKGEQNLAYRNAMRILQDRFFTDVASGFGLLRLGPRRLRLSRADYRKQQNCVRLYAAAQAVSDRPVDDLLLQPARSTEVDKILCNGQRGLWGGEAFSRQQVLQAVDATPVPRDELEP